MTARGDEPERVLVVWCPGCRRPGLGWGPGPGAAAGHQAAAFGQVVSAVEELCPRVEVLRPGACAIAARGPARYFGGEEALAGEDHRSGRRLRLACRVGVAEGLFAAQLAAVAGRTGWPRPGRSRRWLLGRTRAFLAPLPGQRAGQPGSPGSGGPAAPAGRQDAGGFRGAACRRGGEPVRGSRGLAHRLARGLDPRPLAPRPPPADLSVQRGVRPARRRRPSPWCSPPRRWPSGCMTGLAASGADLRAGAGAGALRGRPGASPGCGGTTGCCPHWRWPSGSAGNWPAGARPGGAG